MEPLTPSWLFWLLWALAFLAFPIGGLAATAAVGPVSTPLRGLIGGAAMGAVLGVSQWFILRLRLPLPIWWIVATSLGMAVGLAISTALLGSETAGSRLLWRAALTGLCIGIAQCIVLSQVIPLPLSGLWGVVVTVGWVLGWAVTRRAGIDLGPKWAVFGSSGAIMFQLVTGIALAILFRWSS
jgi:hypothetical protein